MCSTYVLVYCVRVYMYLYVCFYCPTPSVCVRSMCVCVCVCVCFLRLLECDSGHDNKSHGLQSVTLGATLKVTVLGP